MGGLSYFDLLVVFGYFGMVMAAGMWFGRKSKDTADFVNGGRSIPTWAVVCSIVATEISAVTFLAVPGVGYSENLNYLQFGLGSLAARFVIAALFLGLYYKFNCLSIYEFLAHRFGQRTRLTASILFLITRLMASGLRLFVAAKGLAIFFDAPLSLVLGILTLTTLAYTASGGIKAVVATDVIQAAVFIGGALAVLILLHFQVGWEVLLPLAQEADKLQFFRWQPAAGADFYAWLNDANLFYLAFINGLVMTTAALGVDQDLAQRMISCKDVKSARRSVVLSGIVGIPVGASFLFIGIGLWGYFQVNPVETLPTKGDDIFPYFITNYLPSGMKGFLLAGLLAATMSSLSSTLGSMSASAVIDIVRPWLWKTASEAEALRLSRVMVVVFGALLALVAYACRDLEGLLWWSFKAGGITYGSLLGVFLLGVLFTKRGSDFSNPLVMLASALFGVGMLLAIEAGYVELAWTWLVILGTLMTLFIGALFKSEQKQ